MKKKLFIAAIMVTTAVMLTACGSSDKNKKDDVTVTDGVTDAVDDVTNGVDNMVNDVTGANN